MTFRGELDDYMSLLARNFNVATLANLMCRNLISVGHDGSLYDCDFNQQLAIGMRPAEDGTRRRSVFDLDSLDVLRESPTATDNHCFGCTAGQGSS